MGADAIWVVPELRPALADLLDDAVVTQGATDKILHCWGFQPGYGSAAAGGVTKFRLT